ncbi:molybdate transport repressor ModE-like protein [Aminobacter lissarensis]|uniref:Molybdate transport repressor ModE-like protein n=1 Tax=Aminobacter carboxidus TaxID=376165 RepID=A0A8E1WMU8_9HYPH|nr:LysR family transcriptional regulator [Aminobacter lissarensis]MBB6470337.1 molybdate transport repressor ModE-like protein [Aminobacter lissarensis]
MDTATLLIAHNVLTQRSIRGTARLLGKPVSSIAAAIDRLETQISVPLVQRAGTGIILTLEAERLSASIGKLADHVQEAMSVGSRPRSDTSLTLNALSRFVQVTEAGSIRRAAKQLGLGQPQLARQIAHVEALLGCRLLNRHVGGATMTEAGKRLVRSARAIEAIWNELAFEAAGRSRRSAATIRLGSIIPMGHNSFVATLLASLVSTWMDNKPRRPLLVASTTTEGLITGLKSGAYDAVFLNSVSVPTDFDGFLVAKSPLSLVGQSSAIGSAQGRDDLAKVVMSSPIALPSPKSGLRQIINRLLAEILTEDEVRALQVIEVDSMPVILNLVLHHGAVSVLPSESVTSIGGDLSQISLPPEYDLPYWLVCGRSDSSHQTARAVLDVLEELGYGDNP